MRLPLKLWIWWCHLQCSPWRFFWQVRLSPWPRNPFRSIRSKKSSSQHSQHPAARRARSADAIVFPETCRAVAGSGTVSVVTSAKGTWIWEQGWDWRRQITLSLLSSHSSNACARSKRYAKSSLCLHSSCFQLFSHKRKWYRCGTNRSHFPVVFNSEKHFSEGHSPKKQAVLLCMNTTSAGDQSWDALLFFF